MSLHVGWHLAVWVLLIGTTRERRMKPPDPDLHCDTPSVIVATTMSLQYPLYISTVFMKCKLGLSLKIKV
jgi:hypothetical protein